MKVFFFLLTVALFYLSYSLIFQAILLMKSQIVEQSADAQQVARIARLEESNTLLRAELDTARSKLVEVEHHERALTSENEGLKKDLEDHALLMTPR
jgi:cell division protein FtsB